MRKETFMNMLHKAMYMAFAMLTAFTVAACSNDDEGEEQPSFDTPQYESVAAKYTITSDDSPYTSVELTASGNYIIQTRSTASGLTAASNETVATSGKTSMLNNGAWTAAETRNVIYSNILYGTFTQTGDNEYTLEGFGTLVVTEEDGTSYSLKITTTDGTSYTLKGNKAGTMTAGTMTDALCRTWDIAQWRAYTRMNGNTLFDLTANSRNELVEMLIEWFKDNGMDFTEDDFLLGYDDNTAPTQVVFTKSGTYMVVYANDMLAVSTWKWKDANNGVLQYSWNPNTFDDAYLAGEVTVDFSGSNMHVTEGYSETDDGISFEYALVYILEEAK